MQRNEQTENLNLNAGSCPWCGASKQIQRGNVIMRHPPESCCLPRAIWNLSWLAHYASDPDYSRDIQRIKFRALQLLARADDPTAALEEARKRAAAHDGHGNLNAVIRQLAASTGGRQ